MARPKGRHPSQISPTPTQPTGYSMERDPLEIAIGLYGDAPATVVRPFPSVQSQLTSFEDRRTYHPDPYPPARSTRRGNVALQLFKGSELARTDARFTKRDAFQFKSPRHVLICVRRKIRKAVILATTGGGKTSRKRRRNNHSDIRC